MKHLMKILLAALLTSITWSASAATLGYWRFENPGNLGQDLSGNGYDLTLIRAPLSESITDAGPGEGFPKTVPQTGVTNQLAARLWGTNLFYRSYDAGFQVMTQFTIEAYVNLPYVADSTFTYSIAARYSQSPGLINWMFGLSKLANNPLRPKIFLNGTRSGTNVTLSATATSLTLQTNRDYYMAAVYSNGIITLRLAELTNNPVLVSETLTVTGGWPTNMSSVLAPFTIGGHNMSASATNYLAGLFDEVRYSDVALPVESLLFTTSGQPPELTVGPKSVEAGAGRDAVFAVTAVGAPLLTYQWYDGATLLPLSGKTSSSLVISNVSLADSGKSFYVVVANGVGSVTSAPPVLLTVVNVSGPTVGHWRFEDSGNPGLNSAPLGLNLTSTGGTPSTTVLPDANSGLPGAKFFKHVPEPAGPANTSALSLVGASWLSRNPGAGVAVSTQMTVEAFFNASSVPDNLTMPIASQWDNPAGQRAWLFGVREDNTAGGQIGNLRLRLSLAGAWLQDASRWILQPNVDYYAAVVVNGTNVTFYLADLSSMNPVVESQSYTSSVPVLPASQSDFRVGAILESTGYWTFPGLLDEVRLSRVALPASSLLNPPPPLPTIDQPPQNVVVGEGANASFNVTALGGLPLYYQWYRGSTATPLAGETNSTLTLTNVTLAQNGTTYLVVVTNSSGSVTSSPSALLTVVNVTTPTVGYWRFEDGGNLGLDSSGNGLNLASSGAPAGYSLPATGSAQPGAEFPKTLPGTGQGNANALQLDGTSDLAHQDWPSFTLGNAMSLEVYFNASYWLYNDTTPIASQWDDAANQRSWFLGVRESASGSEVYQLRLALNQGAWTQNATRWNLQSGHDYYAAVVFTNGLVTFYLADLSSPNPVLESQTFTASVTSILDQTADLRVGGVRIAGGGVTAFPGIIDEVRLSRVALPYYSLLNPPPPSPKITTQPQVQVVALASDASFSVTSLGTPPLTYQWYQGSIATPVSGGTGAALVLPNVQLDQSGNSYFVVVSNQYGSATSSVASLTVVDTAGPIIAHWRFENSANLGLNSSGNYLHLTYAGTPVALALPGDNSGLPGAWFSKTLPSTGLTNTGALQLDGSSYLAHPDAPWFNSPAQLTVEAYFNIASFGDEVTHVFGCQYTPAAGARGWIFSAREDNFSVGQVGIPRLRFTVSGDGNSVYGQFATQWELLPNHDYYAAAAYNAGSVQFYLADLSSPSPVLMTQSFTGYPASIFDSTTNFTIGFYPATPPGSFTGVLDEVRVSRVALTPEQLLISQFGGVITSVVINGGSVEINGLGTSGLSYSLLRSINLADWTVVGSSTATNGVLHLVNAAPLSSAGYYRLRRP